MAESEAALAQRLLREQADYLGVSLIEAASDRLDVLDRSPATKITSAVRVSVIEQVRLRSEVWLAFIERHYPAAGPVPSGEALTVMVEAATVRLPVQSRADATWLATRLLRPEQVDGLREILQEQTDRWLEYVCQLAGYA